ncbi:MAG: hypothetical protein AB1792_04250 [Candidatus Zixiibacteriota bacterium]
MKRKTLALALLAIFAFTFAFSAAAALKAEAAVCDGCSKCKDLSTGWWYNDGKKVGADCWEHVCIIPECDEFP